jgi:hypothetical protein
MNAREILDQLDEALAAASFDEGMQVWRVLTALRGPDEDVNSDRLWLKLATTAPIRGAAFPRWITEMHRSPRYPGYCPFDVLLSSHVKGSACPNNHFGNHARAAADVLGIWVP